MELNQQQHSYVQKVGKEFVSSSISSHNTTGTRMKEFVATSNNIIPGTTGINWMLPVFNCLQIDLGTSSSQRSGNSIFIHRLEVTFTLRESQGNNIGPDELGVANLAVVPVITDPRYRLLIVTPKNQYRYAPTSGSSFNTPSFPYYSSVVATNNPEPISTPIETISTYDWGMQLLPDPMYYNVEYDDIRNIKYNTSIGCDSGSFSILIRKNFMFDQNDYGNNSRVRFNDNTLQEMIPQMWFFVPPQLTTSSGSIATTAAYNFTFSCRLIYDNING